MVLAAGLTAKPWLEEGLIDDFPARAQSPLPTAKIGLGVFLAVVTVRCSCSSSCAYAMRMEHGDWRRCPQPSLLWFNTGMLVLSSVAMQWAQSAARRGEIDGVRIGLVAGGAFAVAFPGSGKSWPGGN